MNIKQILQAFVAGLILLFLVWISFYVLLIALAIGAVAALIFYVRRFLIQQGILSGRMNANSNVNATSARTDGPVIETDYQDVTSDEEPKA